MKNRNQCRWCLCIMAFFIVGIGGTGCVTPRRSPPPRVPVPQTPEEHSYPLMGNLNNVIIAAKDFTSVGIVFVSSEETTDARMVTTGSKVTYEMFMREAVKLQADDVINIKIDVKQTTEKQTTRVGDRMITRVSL